MNKPPSPKLSPWHQFQKSALQLIDRVTEAAGKTAHQAGERLREFDEAHSITATVAQAGTGIHEGAKQVDERYNVSGTTKAAIKSVSEGVEKTAVAFKQAADDHGITKVVRDKFVDPLREVSKIVGSSEMVRKTREVTEGAYGAARRGFKDVLEPDLPTYDSDELLQWTKKELNYIAACILQISPEESSRIGSQFSRAVTAKIAGAASTSALLAIVAAFGHAGTGAAISGLSGAAAASATMAWVGGFVGGGVAAGAALTGGLAIVVGLTAYRMLSSEHRDFEAMSPLEQRIVQSCWMLAAVADAYQKRPHEFTPVAASELLENALTPLQRDIEANITILCLPLDGKHAVAMREHALPDFRSAVIDRFYVYLSWAHSDEGHTWHAAQVAAAQTEFQSKGDADGPDADVVRVMREGNAEAAIGGVFAALLTNSPLDDSTESRLVLKALRRTSTALNNASEDELGDYLRSTTLEGWKGMASNVKGIYHELWYVEKYNATHEGTFARLHEATNHPGADVQICASDTGEVIREVQLKAVETTAAVDEHLQRYSDIEVAVTDEAAGKIDDVRVGSSGFSNDLLREDAQTYLGKLKDDTVGTRMGDSALIALGIASTAELVQMLRGVRAFPEAVLNTASKVGVAAGATALTAFLFG